MKDVTDLLLNYLEAKRHLWNTYFLSKVRSLRQCGALDHFEEIDRQLFAALVVRELCPDDPDAISEWQKHPWTFLRVAPREGFSEISLMLSDQIVGANRKWNRAESHLVVAGSDFGFVEFFEWDVYGHVCYPHIRMKIDSHSRTEMENAKEALCEVSQVRILYKKGVGKKAKKGSE